MDNQAVPPETKETKSNKEWSDKLTKYAARGTGIYFLILAGLLFGRYDQLWTKNINELGDFLAGAFGPVAFLWLVIGYLMQHSELKLNRISIEKQAQELELTRLAYQQQIAEFKASVDVAKDSFFFNKMMYLEKRRESTFKNQPRISRLSVVINASGKDYINDLNSVKYVDLAFYNDGAEAASLVLFSLMLDRNIFEFNRLGKGNRSIKLNYNTIDTKLDRFKSLSIGMEMDFDNLQIAYNDINNVPQEMEIILVVTREETDKYIFRGEFVSHHDTSTDVVGD